jgi:protein-tyrosine phosphatase
MAAALLRKELAAHGLDVNVSSAGTRARPGLPPTDEAIAAMSAHGLDITEHRSRGLDAEQLAAADVILTMAREQLRDLVVRAPETWRRTFTLREIVRRADEVGQREDANDETFADWSLRLGGLRTTAALLDRSRSDDVDDPIGRSQRFYAQTAATLEDLVARFVRAAWPARIGDVSR